MTEVETEAPLTDSLIPRYSTPAEVKPEDAFVGDLFNRKPLAERLIHLIGRMKDGFVLSVDSGWGSGKTYFARHTVALMKKQPEDKKDTKTKVVYLDAFKNDFLEEPFLLIAAEILKAIGKNDEAEKAIGRIIRSGMLVTGKEIGLQLVKHWTGADLQDAIDKVTDQIERDKDIATQLKERYEAATSTITDFKTELNKALQGKQLVIFIDELDRCKPPFSVKLLEYLKHLFDVKGLVFVLMINREALVSSIAGVYHLDKPAASEYLNKFINLDFKIPVITTSNYKNKGSDDYIAFCRAFFQRNFKQDTQAKQLDHFIQSFSYFCEYYKLPLRKIETGAINWITITPRFEETNKGVCEDICFRRISLCSWFVALKLHDIDLFSYFVNLDPYKHKEAEPTSPEIGFKLSEIADIFEDKNELSADTPARRIIQGLGADIKKVKDLFDRHKELFPHYNRPENKTEFPRNAGEVREMIDRFGLKEFIDNSAYLMGDNIDYMPAFWAFLKHHAQIVDL